MALTGTLLADFSAFRSEADASAASLKQMESGADAAAKRLSNIGESVNVKAAITDPMSTAEAAVGGVGDALVAMELVSAAAVTGLTAVGSAMFVLAEHSASVISGFDNLADKTGMSVPALSRLSNAAAVVGADFTQLTGVVATLERNIGTNSKAFQDGLKLMGLSTDALKAVGPDRYLETIIDGLNNIDAPSQRAKAGAEVLGAAYKQVAGSLKDLQDGYDATKDINPFTAEQAAAAEHFMNQLGSIKVHLESLAVAFGAPLIAPMSTFLDILGKIYDLGDKIPAPLKAISSPGNLLTAAFNEAGAAVDYFIGSAAKLPATTEPAARGMETLKENAKELLLYVPTLKDATAATKEVDAAQGAWEKSTRAIADAMAGWQTILATIPADVQASAAAALSAGASQHDVETAFKLSAAQVKALSISLEENSKAMQTNADFATDAANRRKEITASMTKATNDGIIATLNAKLGDEAFLAGNLKAAQQQDAAQQALTASTKSQYQQRADAAKAAYDAAYANASTSQERIEQLGAEWMAAQQRANEETKAGAAGAAGSIGDSFEQGYGRSAAASRSFSQSAIADAAAAAEAAAALTAVYETTQGRLDAFNAKQAANPSNILSIVGMFGGLPAIQTRDSGGPVVAGQSYLIGGGKAPEIFTPGASGFVTPGGTGGGGSHVTQNIYITQPLGTADAIARAVADAQVQLMKGQGVRLPYGT